MKSVWLAAPASEELAEAVRWYEQRRPGLGAQFFDAVVSVMSLIQAHPRIGRVTTRSGATRRMRVAKFPYSVVYRERQDAIEVLAVAHGKRRPGYWKRRS